MNQYNDEFWEALDELVSNSQIVIDRPKGSSQPKYKEFIYQIDYGYLKNTSSMDGMGIDVWVGSAGKNVDAILVDIHGEATSEKLALGFYLDGRVSAVCGTHTHVPTADYRILENGTGYITDVGMCGDFNSVLGFEKEAPMERLAEKLTIQNKLIPARGKEHTIWGVVIETDKTGKCENIEQIKEVYQNM